jgi:hypothetical protein
VKQPYYIHLAGDEPLVMAGLWDVWEGPEGPMPTYTVLTTGRRLAGRAARSAPPRCRCCFAASAAPTALLPACLPARLLPSLENRSRICCPASTPARMPLAMLSMPLCSGADSSKRLEWLHDRMPVILRDKQAQQLWLDTTDPAAMG